jgi:hypothetical protein
MPGSDPRIRLAVLGIAVAATIAALPLVARARAAAVARPENVPRLLANAAAMSVADFAYGLAEAGVSAGFVVLEGDSIESSLTRGTQPLWHLRRQDAGLVPLEDALDIFRTAHPDYEVESSAGVLRIRARAIATASSLFTKRTAHVRMEGLPLPSALNRAMRAADPSIPTSDGVVGSVVSSADSPPFTLSNPPRISVDLTQATFLDVLDEIVGQAPGTVWLLSRHWTPHATYFTLTIRVPNGLHTVFHDKLGAR